MASQNVSRSFQNSAYNPQTLSKASKGRRALADVFDEPVNGFSGEVRELDIVRNWLYLVDKQRGNEDSKPKDNYIAKIGDSLTLFWRKTFGPDVKVKPQRSVRYLVESVIKRAQKWADNTRRHGIEKWIKNENNGNFKCHK